MDKLDIAKIEYLVRRTIDEWQIVESDTSDNAIDQAVDGDWETSDVDYSAEVNDE